MDGFQHPFMIKMLNAVQPEEIKKSTDRRRQIFRQVNLLKPGVIKERTNGPKWDTVDHPSILEYQQTAHVDLVPSNQVTLKELAKNVMVPSPGKYFLCRTITEPVLTPSNAVQVVVEDPTGDKEYPTIRINLYNWILDEEFDPRILPRGTTLILKNPWPCVFELGVGIRMDNPADVEINNEFYTGWGPLDLTINQQLGEKSPDPVKDFKEKGNAYFLQGKFHSAIRNYSFGLQKDPSDISLYTNRAACYLKTRRPLEALADSEAALELDPGNVKAIWRKAVALSRTNKQEQAIEVLKSKEDILKTSPDLTSLLHELVKLRAEYLDPKLRRIELANHSAAILNLMEFEGPVKIVPIAGKGRGLVATRNVKEGEILMACRAFEILTQDYSNEIVLDKTQYVSMRHRFMASIAHRLKEYPELRAQLYQLDGGPKHKPLDPNTVTDPNVQASLLVDINRIMNILIRNAHGPEVFSVEVNRKRVQRLMMSLYVLSSFINHTCVTRSINVCLVPNGDFSLAWAAKDIPVGKELLTSYFDTNGMKYKDRKERIDKLGFRCACPLCIKKK